MIRNSGILLLGVMFIAWLAGCDNGAQPTMVATTGAVPRQEVADCSERDEVCIMENGHMVVKKLESKDAEFTGHGCGPTDSTPPPPPNYDAAIAAIRAYTQNPNLELTPFKTKCQWLTTWYCSGEYCWAVANATNQVLDKQRQKH